MRLAIHIVTYNAAEHISALVQSMNQQTYKDFIVRIHDNASTDETVSTLHAELQSVRFPYELFAEEENTYFVGGHNHLYSQLSSEEEFLLLLNPDVTLEPDAIERLIAVMDREEEVGACGPRLMQSRDGAVQDTIDTLGLRLWPNRRVTDDKEGLLWSAVKDLYQTDTVQVFGISGACPLYRVAALRAVSADGYLFDPAYKMYKEDVDLAYRLNAAGWQAVTVPDAVGSHVRSTGGAGQLDDRSRATQKKQQPTVARELSYVNHLRNLKKHESLRTLGLDLLAVLWYELKKAVWFLFHEPRVLRGLRVLWTNT